MRILKENTIGLVIDIQERLFPHIYKHQELEKNSKTLIEGLKALKIPILVTQQYTKGLGPTIEPINISLGNYNHLEKMAFSCCDDNIFMNELKKCNLKNVIIIGIEAHVCVLQTTIDLIENGFNPIVIEDCISSRTLNNKNIAVERMREEGAIISTYESILFELCRYSGTDSFKTISKLVK
jgi:nicotinamidase-related amidase